MRRDRNDKEWQETKEKVKARDKGTNRMLGILTYKEFLILKKNAGSLLNILDPAHYKAVSSDPELIYDFQNVCLLDRWTHSCLDGYIDPITREHISKEKVQEWWERILKGNKVQYEYLKNKGLI